MEESKKKSESIFLQIVEHPDGTITRPFSLLAPPLNEDPDGAIMRPFSLLAPPLDEEDNSNSSILIKDVPLDAAKGTYLRLYLPRAVGERLPVILFFHGGGFVLFGPDSLPYHNFCLSLSLSLPALVVSASYRLAPENPLPAAYLDALEAVHFVCSPKTTDPWITDHGDLCRFYMMGSSSGANIAYQTVLRHIVHENLGIHVSGLVLNQPYFGGVKRTKSEAESEEDAVLPLRASDMMWRLALPRGADRDHEYCNPAATADVRRLPRCLVKGSGGDPLVDRQREFVEMLEAAGVEVAARFDCDGLHAAELFDPDMAEQLVAEVREFVYC